MPNPFVNDGKLRTHIRRTLAKIGALTGTALGAGELMLDEQGNVYGGDGSTFISALKRLMRVGELRINAADYGASPSASASANVTAIQAAADAAATANGVLFIPGGTYSTNGQITLRCNVDVHPAAVLSYTGPSSTVALQVGDGGSGVTYLRKIANLPRVVNANKTVNGWAQTGVAGTVGVQLVNCYACKIHVPHVNNFATGLRHYGFGTGHVYNNVSVGHLENNQVNEQMSTDSTGWCNQNKIDGGFRQFYSGEGTNVAGTRDILIDTTTGIINNNIWRDGSVEGGTPEFHIECNGSFNYFKSVRWEVTGGGRVKWGSVAIENVIDRGYNAHLITETGASSANLIIAKTTRWRAAAGTGGVFVYENASSSANPVDIIMAAGAATAGSDPTTAYLVSRSGQKTAMKTAADSFDRIQLDHVNGRLYLGNAAAAPAVFLSGTATAFLVGGSAVLSPGADATQDLGATSLRWRHILLSGGLSTGVTTTAADFALGNNTGGTILLNYSVAHTATLATAAANSGKLLRFRNIGSATATIASAGGNVDAASTQTLAAGAKVAYQSDGTNWWSV